MAVISHCGVDYTAPTVEVQSDASATSLEATKVPTGQTITSYLNSNFLWKVVGSAVSGNTEIALPSGWTELLVIVGTTSTTGNRDNFSVHIHGSSCSSNANNFFYSGAYFSSTVNNGIQLKMTGKSKIQLTTAYANGASVINNLSTAVYYK